MKTKTIKKNNLVGLTLLMSFALVGCGGANGDNRLELRVNGQNVISDHNSEGYRTCRGSNNQNFNNNQQNFQNQNFGTMIQIDYSSDGRNANLNNGGFGPDVNSTGGFTGFTNGAVTLSLSIGQGQQFGQQFQQNTNNNGYYIQNINVGGLNNAFVNPNDCTVRSINESNERVEGRIECNLAGYGSTNGQTFYDPNDERYRDDRNTNQNYQINMQSVEINFSCRKI